MKVKYIIIIFNNLSSGQVSPVPVQQILKISSIHGFISQGYL